MKQILALLIFLYCPHILASTTVRLTIDYDNKTEFLNIDLYENLVPLTVENFLNYSENNLYKDSLIHNTLNDVFIQSGKYTFDSGVNTGLFEYDAITETFNGGLQPILQSPPINSEFRFSNVRGAIAMIIKDGDINSATSEWLINLGNNIEAFDFQSLGQGVGLTVFGNVIENDEHLLDEISAITRINLAAFHPDFNLLPVNDYQISETSPEDITTSNLVRIRTIDKLYNVTSFVDFGSLLSGEQTVKDIEITNFGLSELLIGSINASDLNTPFEIIDDQCSETALSVNTTCIIQVRFTMPENGKYFNDALLIDLVSEGRTIKSQLTNTSPDIDSSHELIDFGLIPVYTDSLGLAERIFPLIYNRGFADLNISNITLDGPDKAEFELKDNCTTEFNIFAPGLVPPTKFCSFGITFKPTSLDEKFASVIIVSDDPDTAELVIPIHGGATSDSDGVPPDVEDSSPNAGDGNNDTVADKLQSNVASFLNADNSYTTLITHEDGQFSNVTSVQLSTLNNLPDNITLAKGAFSFELVDISAGSIAEFGLILASGNSPGNIYSYGPTTGNNTPHWYTLENNEIPGAIMFGNVSLQGESGDSISRNITTVSILDGGNGDSDLQVNGKILFVGGPEINNQSSSSSGVMLWMLFLMPALILVYRR